ncbi:MAG: hypothetical protein WCX31_00085 [Salinivirgaceae bacterium]|jgi:serine/threonine protein phosphatase PrpC
MAFNLKYIQHSKKGIRRDRNQDRSLIIAKKNYTLFMVFDGVSSRPDSYHFINKFKATFRNRIKNLDLKESNLNCILFEVHNDILKLKINGSSTLSILFFNNKEGDAGFINIGDSRIYHFNNQYLEQITVDDSLPGISNIITKYLGMEKLSLMDFALTPINLKGDYLMCTDGFYGLMENNLKDYFFILNFKYLRNIKKYILKIQRRKNEDDSSFIIIKNEISI